MIGSQEWRFDAPGIGRHYLATRCGITAPGRSAGQVTHLSIKSYRGPIGGWLVRGDDMRTHRTRAEAAAASYKAYADNLMSEHMQAFAARRSMIPPALSGGFWLDAYRYCR